mgnify:CR=1 FL=1
MSRLLFLSLRDGAIGPEVSRAEYNDVLNATGLAPDQVERRLIPDEHTPLGNLEGFDGIIVGGSSLNITNEEWSAWQHHVDEVLSEVVAGPRPVFFVCFGLSWLTHHLGGTVVHTHPEAAGPTVVKLLPEAENDPLVAGLPEEFTALTGHTENAEPLPAKLELLASGSTCPVQIVRYGDHVWATQFHAEMDHAAMKARMDFFYDYGYFPAAEYDTIVASLPSVDTTYANELLRRFIAYCGVNN